MHKRSKAQMAALVAGRKTQAQKKLAEDDAKATYAAALDTAKIQLEITQAELQASQDKGSQLYKTVRVEHRKAQRAVHVKLVKDAELETTKGSPPTSRVAKWSHICFQAGTLCSGRRSMLVLASYPSIRVRISSSQPMSTVGPGCVGQAIATS
jgi:hypothetical protein